MRGRNKIGIISAKYVLAQKMILLYTYTNIVVNLSLFVLYCLKTYIIGSLGHFIERGRERDRERERQRERETEIEGERDRD